jgi:glycosyltransferase involved in cell wall biosynthesis
VKVLLVFGHPDRVEANLILGLAEAGIEVEMTCDPIDQFRDTLTANGIRITSLELKNRIDLSSILSLRKILKAGNFDIVHSFSSRALSNSLLASIGLKVKHVAYRGTSGHLSRFDPAAWLSYLNPKVAKIICVSNAVKEYLRTCAIPERRLVTIYKGHDPSWYHAVPRQQLAEFNIPKDAIVIGCSANMRRVKGVDVLINAFEQLNIAATHLLLVGEIRDNSISKLHRASPVKDRIHLSGYRSDAAALMGACDIFVMPSREREGLPKAVIEAMSLGVATIVSKVGGMPEIVENMQSGLVVEPDNVTALSAAIGLLVSDPGLRARLAHTGFEHVRKMFSITATIQETVQTYRKIIS